MKHIRIYAGLLAVILAMGVALVIVLKSRSSVEKEWKDAVENVKAYSEQCSASEKKNRAFKLTIEQLESSNDSIFMELDNARKKLKIKDANLQSLHYVSSDFAKADTIILNDTLFKSPELNVDTLLSDKWYSIQVGLEYPSTIAVKPMFRSVKHIVVSTRKETVNPPKKFFLFRWFQKKHTVLNVDVVEENPYVQSQSNRYVEILR